MNCKPGDLAVIVRSRVGNAGRIVRCVEYAGEFRYLMYGVLEPERCASWRIDPPIPAYDGTLTDLIKDSALRPIRDNDGEDQTLTWAPKHEGVTA